MEDDWLLIDGCVEHDCLLIGGGVEDDCLLIGGGVEDDWLLVGRDDVHGRHDSSPTTMLSTVDFIVSCS